MTIEKKIEYLEGAEKVKFIADLRARYEKAIRDGKFKGDLREFALKERMQRIKEQSEYKKGGPVKPNGATTISLTFSAPSKYSIFFSTVIFPPYLFNVMFFQKTLDQGKRP